MVRKAGKVSALMAVWQTPMHPSKPSSVATSSWRHLPIAPTSDPVKAPSASSASFTVTLEAGQAVFLVGGRVEKEGSMTSLKPQSPQLKQASPFLVPKSEGETEMHFPNLRAFQGGFRLTHPNCRGLGLGPPTLSLTCVRLFVYPLYPLDKEETLRFEKSPISLHCGRAGQ